MLRRINEAKQRWGGQHAALDRWLEERQEVIVGYFQLAGLPPYTEDSQQLPAAAEVQAFCELLVDYISAGHFELYEHLLKEANEHGPESLAIARRLYPLIAVTTEIALKFNDSYAELESTNNWENFDQDLSELGEAIELRLELEDQLLQQLAEQVLATTN